MEQTTNSAVNNAQELSNELERIVKREKENAEKAGLEMVTGEDAWKSAETRPAGDTQDLIIFEEGDTFTIPSDKSSPAFATAQFITNRETGAKADYFYCIVITTAGKERRLTYRTLIKGAIDPDKLVRVVAGGTIQPVIKGAITQAEAWTRLLGKTIKVSKVHILKKPDLTRTGRTGYTHIYDFDIVE